MAFNFGAFAGGAAKGYSEGQENQRKMDANKREQERHDNEKKRKEDQEAFAKAAKEMFFPEVPQAPQAPVPENVPSVVKVNANPYGPADGIATAMMATPSAQDKLMPDATGAVQPGQPAAPVNAPYAANGISMPSAAKPKADDAQQATQGWGDAFAKNPDLFGDPQTMLKLGKLAMEYNQPDALQWLERGHKAYKENGIVALQRLAGGDLEGAKQAFNSSGRLRVDNFIDNKDGTYQAELPDGRVVMINPEKQLKSHLDPQYYFKTLNDERQLAEHERHNKEDEKLKNRDLGIKDASQKSTAAYQAGILGVARTKAKESAEGTTAEIKNAAFLINNGIAKTPQDAWEMLKTGKTPAGEQFHFDALGGIAIADRDSGRITKYDAYDGKETVLRPGRPGNQVAAETPPVQGAQKAKDGKWYVKGADGKYSRVD